MQRNYTARDVWISISSAAACGGGAIVPAARPPAAGALTAISAWVGGRYVRQGTGADAPCTKNYLRRTARLAYASRPHACRHLQPSHACMQFGHRHLTDILPYCDHHALSLLYARMRTRCLSLPLSLFPALTLAADNFLYLLVTAILLLDFAARWMPTAQSEKLNSGRYILRRIDG